MPDTLQNLRLIHTFWGNFAVWATKGGPVASSSTGADSFIGADYRWTCHRFAGRLD
jgi:hypothetical protein